jgi:hypothetical protein
MLRGNIMIGHLINFLIREIQHPLSLTYFFLLCLGLKILPDHKIDKGHIDAS